MKNSRIALHNELVEILGNRNVYFQPPSSDKLKYPCIVYSFYDVNNKNADDKPYMRHYMYRLTLIHTNPDNDILDKILNMKYTKLVKTFSNQGLYHYVITINYKNEKEII